MPTVEQAEWFLKTGSIYGLGFIAIAGMLGLVFYGTFYGMRAVIGLVNDVRQKWLPQFVSGHLTFLETTKQLHAVSIDNHGKTHRALKCIAKAQQEDCCDEARKLLDEAIRELK